MLSDFPLKQGTAKVTLQLVVNTGNIQITTTTPLEDRMLRMLMDPERDYVKWTRGELHMDMKNSYSPAIRHFRGQLTTCPNTNSQVPVSQEYNEAIAAVCIEGAGEQTIGVVVV